MIKLLRISKQRVSFSSNKIEEMQFLMKKLTFWVDGYFFSEKFKSGVWDGKAKFYKNDNTFSFGLSKYVKDFLTTEGIQYEFLDFNKYQEHYDLTTIDITESLRPQQKEAVKVIFKKQFGIITIPTRGGKTYTACECVRIARILGLKRSLFIVDGIDLFNQTIDEFSKFLNIPKEHIGQLQGKNIFNFKEINIAMIQSLALILFPKNKKKTEEKFLLEKLLRNIDVVFIDEVQEFTSTKRLETIKRCSGSKIQISLSATPFHSEDPIGNMKLREAVGDVIYNVSEEELINSGSLVKNYLLIVLFRNEVINTEKFNEYYDQNIVLNEKRNFLLKFIRDTLVELNLKSLFMFTRKSHGRLMSEMTGDTFISGDDDGDERKEVKDDFLKNKGGALFASNIYKKGVSLNSCEVLVNVADGLEQSSVIQKRGRVLASSKGKETALIVDIFDNIPYFSEHSKSRLKAYEEKISEENIFVLEYNDEDFENDFKDIIISVFDK